MISLLQPLLALARRHPFVASAFALCAILGIANYFLWDHRQGVARRHEEARRKGETMLRTLSDHTRIMADVAALKEALGTIDRNLAVEEDLEVNLGYFYQMETLSRVRINQLNQLSSLPPEDENPFKAVPFSLRLSGSYSQIIHFLRELETGPRVLRIRSYSFSRGDAKDSNLSLELTVELLGST